MIGIIVRNVEPTCIKESGEVILSPNGASVGARYCGYNLDPIVKHPEFCISTYRFLLIKVFMLHCFSFFSTFGSIDYCVLFNKIKQVEHSVFTMRNCCDVGRSKPRHRSPQPNVRF